MHSAHDNKCPLTRCQRTAACGYNGADMETCSHWPVTYEGNNKGSSVSLSLAWGLSIAPAVVPTRTCLEANPTDLIKPMVWRWFFFSVRTRITQPGYNISLAFGYNISLALGYNISLACSNINSVVALTYQRLSVSHCTGPFPHQELLM